MPQCFTVGDLRSGRTSSASSGSGRSTSGGLSPQRGSSARSRASRKSSSNTADGRSSTASGCPAGPTSDAARSDLTDCRSSPGDVREKLSSGRQALVMSKPSNNASGKSDHNSATSSAGKATSSTPSGNNPSASRQSTSRTSSAKPVKPRSGPDSSSAERLPSWTPSGSQLCDVTGQARRQVEAMYSARRQSAVEAAHKGGGRGYGERQRARSGSGVRNGGDEAALCTGGGGRTVSDIRTGRNRHRERVAGDEPESRVRGEGVNLHGLHVSDDCRRRAASGDSRISHGQPARSARYRPKSAEAGAGSNPGAADQAAVKITSPPVVVDPAASLAQEESSAVRASASGAAQDEEDGVIWMARCDSARSSARYRRPSGDKTKDNATNLSVSSLRAPLSTLLAIRSASSSPQPPTLSSVRTPGASPQPSTSRAGPSSARRSAATAAPPGLGVLAVVGLPVPSAAPETPSAALAAATAAVCTAVTAEPATSEAEVEEVSLTSQDEMPFADACRSDASCGRPINEASVVCTGTRRAHTSSAEAIVDGRGSSRVEKLRRNVQHRVEELMSRPRVGRINHALRRCRPRQWRKRVNSDAKGGVAVLNSATLPDEASPLSESPEMSAVDMGRRHSADGSQQCDELHESKLLLSKETQEIPSLASTSSPVGNTCSSTKTDDANPEASATSTARTSATSAVWRRGVSSRVRYRWQQLRRRGRPQPAAFWRGFKEYGVNSLPRLAEACHLSWGSRTESWQHHGRKAGQDARAKTSQASNSPDARCHSNSAFQSDSELRSETGETSKNPPDGPGVSPVDVAVCADTSKCSQITPGKRRFRQWWRRDSARYRPCRHVHRWPSSALATSGEYHVSTGGIVVEVPGRCGHDDAAADAPAASDGDCVGKEEARARWWHRVPGVCWLSERTFSLRDVKLEPSNWWRRLPVCPVFGNRGGETCANAASTSTCATGTSTSAADAAADSSAVSPTPQWRHLGRSLLPCLSPPNATPSARLTHKLSGPCGCEHCLPTPPPAAGSAPSGGGGKLAEVWDRATAAVSERMKGGGTLAVSVWPALSRACSLRLSNRAEKSEVLTEDLAASERRVEALRGSCSVIRKRLTESLSGHGTDDDTKRLRKIPEHQLGAAMKEGAGVVGQDTTLGVIMQQCGEAQTRLAQERLQFERQLEGTVLDNSVLQQLLETDIPNVTKLRKTLAKLTLDMDASRSRYQNAQRHSVGTVSAGGTHQKSDAIREELETAQIKVEQHRDTLAGDMFQLLSREPELAQLLLQLVKLQTEHYRSGLQLLEATIPSLQASLNAAAQKPVFGLSLEEHLRVTERQVALPLEMCVCRLLQTGADEEGLFRVAGSTSKVRKLKSCFDAGLVDPPHMLEYCDPHVVADALKAYLRDLPEPLMTTDLYDEWMAAAKVQDEGQRLQALWQVLHQLPELHYTNLRYLIKFLAVLCRNKSVNKMTTQNMAIVMAPNLLWTNLSEGFNVTATGTHSLVVDALIAHADWFFTDDVDFFITYPRDLPAEAPAAAPDSPVLSNGSTRTPGHHRSKSSDSGVMAIDSYVTGESTGSTASLTSDHSPPYCESPRPTLRRKKQAAPPPPAHRQTIASAPRPKPEAAASAAPLAEPEPEPHGIGFEPLTRSLNATIGGSSSQESADSKGSVESAAVASSAAMSASTSSVPSGGLSSSLASALAPAAALATATASTGSTTSAPTSLTPGTGSRPGRTSPMPVPCPTVPPPSAPPTVTDRPVTSAPAVTSSDQSEPSPVMAERHSAGSERPPVAAEKPAVPPVPAPRTGQLTTPGKTLLRPDRPPPPTKGVERAQSFSPSDTGAAPRQKPALPERPGTLKRTRNSVEAVKDSSSSESTNTAENAPAGAPPPIGFTGVPAEPRPRPKPTTAPPPVPAPRGDTTKL